MIVPCNFAGYNTDIPIIGASHGPRVEARVEVESVVVEALGFVIEYAWAQIFIGLNNDDEVVFL